MFFSKVGATYLVTLDDGTEHEVITDGRDWAALEAKQFPPGSLLTSVRFMAYNAMKRNGQTKRSWEQFNTADCVSIDDISPDDEDAEDEKRLDPGKRAPNGTAESTSRSSPGSRTRGRAASSNGTTGT
jgi:hypothetical protein